MSIEEQFQQASQKREEALARAANSHNNEIEKLNGEIQEKNAVVEAANTALEKAIANQQAHREAVDKRAALARKEFESRVAEIESEFEPIKQQRSAEVAAEKLSHIPEKLQKEHSVCSVCNESMVASKSTKFDTSSGQEKDVYIWMCPLGHDSIEIQ